MRFPVSEINMAGAIDLNYQSTCTHYKRNCRLLAPCCQNAYSCHICHDQEENHLLNRHSITKHLCVRCNALQPVNTVCSSCGIEFGEYACVLCYMFDEDTKEQFHCLSCGICRVGGAHNFFHCEKCNMCLGLQLIKNHKCVENCVEGDCPVCTEYLHTTRRELHVPRCGHLIHKLCHEQCLEKGFKSCLVCKEEYKK